MAHRMIARGGVAFLLIMALAMISTAVLAEVEGPCSASFNGIDVGRIDTPGTALEVDVDGTILVTGTDTTGTSFAEVGLRFGPFNAYLVDAEVTDDGVFSQEVPVEDYSTWGVGLYEVVGRTDDCTGNAFVRVTGASPFTTVAGIAGLVLAALGLILLLATWIPAFGRGGGGTGRSVFGGLFAGLGAILLLQQAGITPLSTQMLAIGIFGGPVLGILVTFLGKKVGGGASGSSSAAPTAPPSP